MTDFNSLIEKIRERADIVEIISEYVSLKKRGKNYLSLCPFHSEKTPSFTVSQEKQLFHCFGCGEGGNVFSFLMKIENISFLEAAKLLADKYSIPFEVENMPQQKDKTKNKILYEINTEATIFYTKQFHLSKPALEFAKNRGLSNQQISFFKIGYAPNEWDSLYRHLLGKGFLPKDIELAGLILPRNDQKTSFYDRFRNRIIFPIFDLKSNICGFGARAIDDSQPKYINSPETPIYNKSEILYGLNFSKEEIKQSQTALIVEGYMDFISCYSNGIKNTVATSGTSFTANHIKILQRYAKNFYLVFDSDSAGSNATEKTISLLKEFNIYPKIVIIKGAKDPDEAIKKFGAKKMTEFIDNALTWLKFKIDNIILSNNIKDAEGKATALRECIKILLSENDKVIIEEYSKYVAEKLNINKEIIDTELKRRKTYNTISQKDVKINKPDPGHKKAEKILIRLSIEEPKLLNKISELLCDEDFTGSELKNIFIAIKNSDKNDFEHNISAKIIEQLDDETKKYFSKIMLEEIEFEDKEKAFDDCIKTIKASKIKRQLLEIRAKMHEAEKQSDLSRITALQEEYKQCHDKIKSFLGEF